MNTETKQTQRLDLPSWRFKPSKLGCLKSNPGEIEFKPLTLVCGPNNTGKTWVMYALYGFLGDFRRVKLPGLKEVAEKLAREGQVEWDFHAWLEQHASKIIQAINQATKNRLPDLFNGEAELFSGSSFDWEIAPNLLVEYALARPIDSRLMLGRERNEVLRLLKGKGEKTIHLTLSATTFPELDYLISDMVARSLVGNPPRHNVFLMPAERNGLHLFYRELANRRTALLHHASKKDKEINIGELINDMIRSHYSKPIADYIDWLNDLPSLRKKKSGEFHTLAEEIKKLVGGRYDINAEGVITFTPYRKSGRGTKVDEQSKMDLDLHLASSTVKSLFGLWAYLEYSAQPGDVLMIDEPELNLHPGNQRKLARFLAKLVNSDLRVVVSTHSDYLVREINSLLMLSRPHAARQGLMDKFGYAEDELLRPEQVAAWLFTDGKIAPMKIDAVEGIHAQTFDDQIHQLNDTSDSIYYAYQDDSESGA
jgi:AAA15 family ATPase/GTPase